MLIIGTCHCCFVKAYNDIMSKEKKETIPSRKIFIEPKQSFVLVSVGVKPQRTMEWQLLTPGLCLVLWVLLVIWYNTEGSIHPDPHQNGKLPRVWNVYVCFFTGDWIYVAYWVLTTLFTSFFNQPLLPECHPTKGKLWPKLSLYCQEFFYKRKTSIRFNWGG